jgi:hypothetical protein
MAGISSHHRIAQIQRGVADQEVLKRNLDAAALLFAIDLPREKCNLLCQG